MIGPNGGERYPLEFSKDEECGKQKLVFTATISLPYTTSRKNGHPCIDGPVFCVALEVSAELLFPFFRKFWKSNIFISKWRKGITVNIPMKSTRTERDL